MLTTAPTQSVQTLPPSSGPTMIMRSVPAFSIAARRSNQRSAGEGSVFFFFQNNMIGPEVGDIRYCAGRGESIGKIGLAGSARLWHDRDLCRTGKGARVS